MNMLNSEYKKEAFKKKFESLFETIVVILTFLLVSITQTEQQKQLIDGLIISKDYIVLLALIVGILCFSITIMNLIKLLYSIIALIFCLCKK